MSDNNREIKEVSEGMHVRGQIYLEEVSEIADMGYKTIICNRPDGEDEGQPTMEELRDAFSKLGVELKGYAVASMNDIDTKKIEGYSKLLEVVERPILAYCRSGGRARRLIEGHLELSRK